jgi:hypothetical protein
VVPAFMSPNGIRRYSKDPNGVVIAVFWISAQLGAPEFDDNLFLDLFLKI